MNDSASAKKRDCGYDTKQQQYRLDDAIPSYWQGSVNIFNSVKTEKLNAPLFLKAKLRISLQL